MTIQKYISNFEKLNLKVLEKWKDIPPAVVSDCMSRSNTMASRICPLAPGMRLVGQARTVTSMVGDNGAGHVAISFLEEGEILVIDAKGYVDVAVWGGIMTRAAIKQKIGGVVVDGAVRDVAEIRELGFPTFAAGVVPKGPGKGSGGIIDGLISCGGCPVMPGDLIIGDDDGIAVVPLNRQSELLEASISKMKNEDVINAETKLGNLPYERFGLKIQEID